MDIRQIIEGAAKLKASDIHLMEDAAPFLRLDGDLMPVNLPPVKAEEMLQIAKELVPEHLQSHLDTRRAADIGFQHRDVTRLRLIVYYERGRLRMVFRLIPLKVLTYEELGLPPVVAKIAGYSRGIVLVTGTTGSGKTTTLAAVIDYMNTNEKISITTVEDPIEFVHQNKRAMVTQREVGKDVPDFTSGIVQALRQDPDVILIGEMRDVETVQTAIAAAQTGHLVLSTLHTIDTVQTVERIINFFPAYLHQQVRMELALGLQGVLSMRLLPMAGGQGRIPAVEVLINTPYIRKLIHEGKTLELLPQVEEGRHWGMQSFNQALFDLVKGRRITVEDAMAYATSPEELKLMLEGIHSGVRKENEGYVLR